MWILLLFNSQKNPYYLFKHMKVFILNAFSCWEDKRK